MIETWVFADAAGLAQGAADHFLELAREAVAGRGRFLVALAGGSTPLATYALLGSEEYSGRVDWPHVHVLWGDERCVGPDDPESNYGQARAALLERVQIPEANIHRIRGELPPEEAAVEYQKELRCFLGPEGRLDLVLLGLGRDGHTASLFRGTAALQERKRWVVAHFVDSVEAWRVTLTPAILAGSRQVTFLVSGAAKAEVLRAALEGPQDPDLLPAVIFHLSGAPVLWLADQEAAAYLR